MSMLDELIISEEEQFINKLGLERFRDVLIDENENKTELYEKLRKTFSVNTPQEIECFKELVYKADKYLAELVSEVLEDNSVNPDIRKMFLTEILEEIILMHVRDDEKLKFRRTVLKNRLFEIRKNQLREFDNSELKNVAQMIQEGLSSESVRLLGMQILKDKSKIGEHTRINPQGLYMGQELRKFEAFHRLVADSIIIHRDISHIDEFIEYLKNRRIKSASFNEMSSMAIDFHIEKIRRENPDISDEDIFNRIYNSYVTNGYIFQGINGAFVDSAEKNGLTTNFSSDGIKQIQRIDEIFKAHGVPNVLLSKLQERSIDSYYYVTDDFTIAQHYSCHNPEYFTFLTSAGPYFNDDKTFDQFAFYKRDISSCLENVKKLCQRYGITTEEQEEILGYISGGFSKLYPNGDVNVPNGIVVAPRMVLKKSLKCFPNKLEGDLHASLESIMGLNVRNNYSCRIDIPAEATSMAKVEPLQSYFKEEEKEEESKTPAKKYIQLADKNMQVYYDIYIQSSDTADIDCIVIDEKQENPELISARAKERPLTVDVIKCNSGLGLYDILDSNQADAQPSFQSLMMMIAVNGVDNSKKGTDLLKKAREEFTPEKMAQYYFFLSNKFLEIAMDKSYDSGIRLTASKRVISDLLPKAVYMSKTNRYPTDVMPNMLMETQFNFGKSNMLRARLNQAQKDKHEGKKVQGMEELIQETEKYTRGFISFNKGYETMCEDWYKRLGFEKELKNINDLIKAKAHI